MSSQHASSTGQTLTGGDWLDNHFEASRPEYEAQLRAVGIRPGWRVLDAACGSGSFLPWLAELVGPGGHLAALDLAPDNVALVEQRVAAWDLPCPVEARVGTVLALPYPAADYAHALVYGGLVALAIAGLGCGGLLSAGARPDTISRGSLPLLPFNPRDEAQLTARDLDRNARVDPFPLRLLAAGALVLAVGLLL